MKLSSPMNKMYSKNSLPIFERFVTTVNNDCFIILYGLQVAPLYERKGFASENSISILDKYYLHDMDYLKWSFENVGIRT